MLQGFHIVPRGCYPSLVVDDKTFCRQCRVDTYMASGPGGQKRNRTYSAVRVTHCTTGLSAIAEESRSQAENRQRAFRRLKKSIALQIRMDPGRFGQDLPPEIKSLLETDGALDASTKNPRFPLVCAVVLDVLLFQGGRISAAAQLLSITTGQLNRIVGKDRDLLVAANRLRHHFNLRPLKS